MMIPIVDDLLWLALTVWQEARGEPYIGKRAVAWTIMNRVKDDRWPATVSDVIFQAYQYSAWNTASPTKMAIDQIRPDDPVWAECYKAACGAYFDLVPDNTGGANHYLNPVATRMGRANRSLPSWYDKTKVTARFGKHEFLRL